MAATGAWSSQPNTSTGNHPTAAHRLMVPAGFALAGPLTTGVFEPPAAAAGTPGPRHRPAVHDRRRRLPHPGRRRLALPSHPPPGGRAPDAIPDPVVLRDKDLIQTRAA